MRSTRANATSARLGFIEISEPLDAERRAARTIVSDTLLTTLTLIVVCGALSGVLGLWLVGRPVRLLCEKARHWGALEMQTAMDFTGAPAPKPERLPDAAGGVGD